MNYVTFLESIPKVSGEAKKTHAKMAAQPIQHYRWSV